jgi:hypothetical protein
MSKSAKKKKQSCSQCGKPAIGQVGDQPLCVECYTKLQNAHVAEQNVRVQAIRHAMAMMNYAERQMYSVVGLGHLSRPVEIPTMPSSGTITLNNIKLDNSVVGAINTGNVCDIDVNLSQLHAAGLDKLGDAIGALTEAIVSDQKIKIEEKDALLEQIAFLSSQATVAAQQRKPGMIKAALGAIGIAATTINSISGAWQICGPMLKKIFGIE